MKPGICNTANPFHVAAMKFFLQLLAGFLRESGDVICYWQTHLANVNASNITAKQYTYIPDLKQTTFSLKPLTNQFSFQQCSAEKPPARFKSAEDQVILTGFAFMMDGTIEFTMLTAPQSSSLQFHVGL